MASSAVDSGYVDTTEVANLAVDLGRLAKAGPRGVRAVIVKGAVNVKNQLKREAATPHRSHLPGFPRSIDFDVHEDPMGVEAEIGPRMDSPQGPLGSFLYGGSARQGPVLPDPMGALDEEGFRTANALAKLVGKL